MEILINITHFLILGLILTFPILLLIILTRLKTRMTLILYAIIGLILLAIFVLLFAWWSYESDLILLKHYGYNINGMNHIDFYSNVSVENMDKVKSLETSIMGIGWPVKAIFGYVTFIPYLICVYIGKVLIERVKKNKNEA